MWAVLARGRARCLLPNLSDASASGIWPPTREQLLKAPELPPGERRGQREGESTNVSQESIHEASEVRSHLEWSREDPSRGGVRSHPGLVPWDPAEQGTGGPASANMTHCLESHSSFFVSIYSIKKSIYLPHNCDLKIKPCL